MAKTIPFFIGGQEVAGKGRTAPVFNPATGEQTAAVSLASTAEVNEAVAVAKKAFPAWAVPASFANRPVSLRIYPDRLVVAAEGNTGA